jgi:8-oxo-dGTP diphosphatase
LSESAAVVRVVAGVIVNQHEEVLISLRQAHQHLAGHWEFPGGKQAQDETAESALIRELHEELDLVVDSPQALYQQEFSYPEKTVQLQFFLVQNYTGSARGMEGQELLWVPVDKLSEHRFPAANTPLVELLANRRIRLD